MPCQPPKTNSDKIWDYQEYYYGERDEERRKNGKGRHHWTGAESLEWYKGRLLRDTMHGFGDYRWRYLGANHIAITYEGKFYNNRMHGYGSLSQPDGAVYNGFFCNNIRWGPGVEYHPSLHEVVGFWYGTQLVRLAWRPAAPSVAIDILSVPAGRSVVAPHRILLASSTRTIGEVNSALELLKQYGTNPLSATEKWTKLYPTNCTDTDSQLCHLEVFDRSYYGNQINTLNKVSSPVKDASQGSKESVTDVKTYYAWNNNKMIVHMMMHCFKHDEQRKEAGIDLEEIISGPRSSFRMAGKHESYCRTLLMASYLGKLANVVQLVNECDVLPNVTDMQGNSVLMYAACGDQPEIIHFLIEAGAEVDGLNDACCTPLGITLLRFALAKWDIAPNGMLQALLPPPTVPPSPPTEDRVIDWNIKRELLVIGANALQKSPSKILKPILAKKAGSLKDIIKEKENKKKSETNTKLDELIKDKDSKNKSGTTTKLEENDSDESVTNDKRVYNNVTNEYLAKVNEAFLMPSGINPIPYIFEVHNMNKDIEMYEEDLKKAPEKNPKKTTSKVIKDTMKPSRDLMFSSLDKGDNLVLDSKEQIKQDKMGQIMLTILQLLSEGADPRNVRCPQPPLFIATVSGSSDLIRHLVNHGADINEVYPNTYGYTTLDIAVAGPLSHDNLNVIRTLLESGAKVDYRLPENVPQVSSNEPLEKRKEDGPTLLHAVLARKVDFEPEEELRRQLLELLLEYGCSPITQCKGRSAMDVAMSKNIDIFDIFIKCPRSDLNAVINNLNQTILLKMFYMPYCKTISLTEKLQTLTNLLLFGADPLLKCCNEKDEYANLFVYANKVISELEDNRKPASPSGNSKKSKTEIKGKKNEKQKKDDKQSLKSVASKAQGKAGDDLLDYKQALNLVVECARLLYIRWLQAKLMTDLIEVVEKFKHRHWNMILKEHKNKKSTGLWLSAARCLEIWDILKTTKKKNYNDKKILHYVLYIVHYYFKRARILRGFQFNKDVTAMTFQEKTLVETEVGRLIEEHRLATMSTPDIVPAIRAYVAPELTVKGTEKFNICFECAMPLEADAKIPCGSCKLIAFCSFECMKTNIDRVNCHPCNNYLKEKYFPTPEDTEVDEINY